LTSIDGPYEFEDIDVKALERRIDGVVLPADPKQAIWAIEVQALGEALLDFSATADLETWLAAHPTRQPNA
jgi:patatin-like phospholipase/acyl hydrolase